MTSLWQILHAVICMDVWYFHYHYTPPPPKTMFVGGGGDVYCFHVVRPSIRDVLDFP